MDTTRGTPDEPRFGPLSEPDQLRFVMIWDAQNQGVSLVGSSNLHMKGIGSGSRGNNIAILYGDPIALETSNEISNRDRR